MCGSIIIDLKKVKFYFEFDDKKTRLNHLKFMDDLKLSAKSHDQIDSVANTVYTFSEDTGMECGIKKCQVLVLKQGKVDKAKSTSLNLPNENLIKTIDEEDINTLEY